MEAGTVPQCQENSLPVLSWLIVDGRKLRDYQRETLPFVYRGGVVEVLLGDSRCKSLQPDLPNLTDGLTFVLPADPSGGPNHNRRTTPGRRHGLRGLDLA